MNTTTNFSARRWTKRFASLFHWQTRDCGVVGHLDGLRDGAAYGWASSRQLAGKHLLVDVFVNDCFVGQRLADMPRPDLLDHGIGDGRHAFELVLPPEARRGTGNSVRAYALAGDRVELRSGSEGEASDVRLAGPKEYLRVTFSGLLGSAAPITRRNDFYDASSAAGERLFDRLFAPSPVSAPPPILGRSLCGYLDYNRFKWGVADKFDATISREDYAAFLKHYVEMYGRARRPMRIPLSACDIAFLNEGPTREKPLMASLGQSLFCDACSPGKMVTATTFENVYRWAVYDSATLCVEDCLVASPHLQLLASCDSEDVALAYPPSRFMKRFLAGNPFLGSLDLAREDERMLAYLALLLFSMRAPHYLRYAPADWLDAFLAPKSKCASLFEQAFREVFRDLVFDADRWDAWIGAQGFDWRTKSFRFLTQKGDRLHSPALQIPRAETVDVQIIGPFSRQLGIADSSRALAAAIGQLDYSLSLCDFALDYPNALYTSDTFALTEPRRAAVNILHFNLEELPSVVAYLPDVLSGSHLVGFPYLELPTPHPAQMLGLTLLDEVWAASSFTAQVLSPFAPTHTVGTACRYLRRIGQGAARRLAYGDLVSESDFVFLTSCDALSGAHRKNPLAVIRAFLAAFPDDPGVKLVLKVHSIDRVRSAMENEIWRRVRSVVAECDRVALFDRMLDDREQMALIEGADCFVSLHRAEGFGYHMLEAMMLETPVLATAYSGNMDFCSEQTAFLVPYRAVHVDFGQYPRASCEQTWADPDFSISVEKMKAVFKDANTRMRITKAARQFAESHYSLEAFARRLDQRLGPLIRLAAKQASRGR